MLIRRIIIVVIEYWGKWTDKRKRRLIIKKIRIKNNKIIIDNKTR